METTSFVMNLMESIWHIWGQMAPFLLLGFAIAGGLHVWIRPSFVKRHLGNGRFLPVLKTTLLGIPLPLCSCGVIPVAASLRQQGASKGATSAFLLATPQTGVDSIAVTYSLMGGFFAVFRPLAALVSGIAGGLIINIFDKDTAVSHQHEKPSVSSLSCSGTAGKDRCGNSSSVPDTDPKKTLRQGFKYGFSALPRDIGRALVLGVIIAGVIGALAPPDIFERIPGGFWVQMFFMMAVGIPIYVCATSSVPIAAALIMKGLSPGAALVFLITGPATNAAAISTIWKIMGRRTALMYLVVVAVFALLSGLAAHYLLGWGFEAIAPVGHDHGLHAWETLSGIVLVIILLLAYFPRPHRAVKSIMSR